MKNYVPTKKVIEKPEHIRKQSVSEDKPVPQTVQYWWTENGDVEICKCKKYIAKEEYECYGCSQKQETDTPVYELVCEEDGDVYHICPHCFKTHTASYPQQDI